MHSRDLAQLSILACVRLPVYAEPLLCVPPLTHLLSLLPAAIIYIFIIFQPDSMRQEKRDGCGRGIGSWVEVGAGRDGLDAGFWMLG
ncbi:uncharacterized protein BDW70DRAFT_135885 [Aspergillus foveolatus]|uniref:uncharacterized protein n=1 Tax=Aspergillus foveolatus TaxID=210207 RepID=UPI003CCCA41F